VYRSVATRTITTQAPAVRARQCYLISCVAHIVVTVPIAHDTKLEKQSVKATRSDVTLQFYFNGSMFDCCSRQ
jgi:hypothetical protein